MINEIRALNSIDLTVDRKFININPITLSTEDSLVSNLAWEEHNQEYFCKHEDDYISKEFGLPIRLGWGGKWIFLGKPKYEHFKFVFDEFMLWNTCGYEGEILKTCMRCGKPVITRAVEPLCDNCLITLNNSNKDILNKFNDSKSTRRTII